MKETQPSPAYQVFALALSLLAIGLLGFQATNEVSSETGEILNYADAVLCGFFFLDFLHSLWISQNRLYYMKTWGWWDLLTCIPTLDYARWGRLARVLRIFRILRGIRATRILSQLILERRSESSILAATLVGLLLIVVSSIAILSVEAGPAGNINTAEDALWWACTTITTVGYGDKFPTSSEGRLIAVLLMVVGVGMFGTFSGFIASWFLAPAKTDPEKTESEKNEPEESQCTLESLQAEIEKLNRLVTQQFAQMEMRITESRHDKNVHL